MPPGGQEEQEEDGVGHSVVDSQLRVRHTATLPATLPGRPRRVTASETSETSGAGRQTNKPGRFARITVLVSRDSKMFWSLCKNAI